LFISKEINNMMQISKEQTHAASVLQDAYQFWLPAGLEKS